LKIKANSKAFLELPFQTHTNIQEFISNSILKLSSITAAVSRINEGNQSENIIDILKLTLLKYIDYIYHHFLEFHQELFIISGIPSISR
jgi:hypothetical protein